MENPILWYFVVCLLWFCISSCSFLIFYLEKMFPFLSPLLEPAYTFQHRHRARPRQSLSLCLSRGERIMSDGQSDKQNGFHTHSARHHRHNDKTLTVTVTGSECVNRPLVWTLCSNKRTLENLIFASIIWYLWRKLYRACTESARNLEKKNFVVQVSTLDIGIY